MNARLLDIKRWTLSSASSSSAASAASIASSAPSEPPQLALDFDMHPDPMPPTTPTTTTTDVHTDVHTDVQWSSAIGHAMTGKSGRVIHALQDQITRLTRECNLHRARAEEAQRTHDLLKLQLESAQDRLHSASQSHDAALITLARRDRKIQDLLADLQRERARRLQSDADAADTAALAARQRDEHQRAIAEASELAARATAQYDALAHARRRDRSEFQSRFTLIRRDFDELCRREGERQAQIGRLDVLLEQKDREVRAVREQLGRVVQLYETYRAAGDEALGGMVEKGRRNDEMLDQTLAEAREAVDKMRWVINLSTNRQTTDTGHRHDRPSIQDDGHET